MQLKLDIVPLIEYYSAKKRENENHFAILLVMLALTIRSIRSRNGRTALARHCPFKIHPLTGSANPVHLRQPSRDDRTVPSPVLPLRRAPAHANHPVASAKQSRPASEHRNV